MGDNSDQYVHAGSTKVKCYYLEFKSSNSLYKSKQWSHLRVIIIGGWLQIWFEV